MPKRGRLWLNDGSCIRLRPEHRNHVWAYDFVFDRTREGRPLKFLTVVDEYTRECLTIEVARRQTSRDVLRTLAKLMLRYGVPKHIRSDNGPEFVAKAVRSWLSRLGVETLFIERAARGKMDTSKVSMGNSGTNYSTVSYSPLYRRPEC